MFQTLTEISSALDKKTISSVELTQIYLEKIAQCSFLNAFISLDEAGALEQARLADKSIADGQGKLLTGIPMAHKDIFCTYRLPTTCGSKMLEHFKAPYQATIVQKLEEAGCIMLGKTNMDEFAMGSSNENSYFGPVKNPWDKSRVPGGSSGGSAAAVAAGLVPFATGSDTGGSIRQPAAFCGISGIKPTYGLVSRFGMVAFASSLDQAGAFARTAEDLALILQFMAGFDTKDSTSMNKALPNYTNQLNQPITNLKIGLPTCFFQEGIDEPIRQAIENAAKQFEKAGAELIEIPLDMQSLWVPCYYVVACAEASSNLSRYDGIRFGHRGSKTDSLIDLITSSRSEGFGAEVKRRILTGTYVLSSGYFDAYYLQALKIRRLIQEELLSQLAKVDFILGPTTPTTAFTIGEKRSNPIQNYLADIFTVAANLAGLPALSIPAGFDKGLPIGMQLIGNHFNDGQLLNLAAVYQRMTDWHIMTPSL